MPKLSIIIPTFNSSRTVLTCLETIASQAFSDFEVVVQDGFSNDDTIDQITRFNENHEQIKISIFREPDAGIYDAMNKGISNATGDWLFFLGSDDELHGPDSLSKAMRFADGETCQVLYGNVKILGEAGWARDGAIYDGPFDLKKLLIRNICHQAIFYRADLLRRVGGFNRNYFLCADWDTNLRCWAQTQFKYIDVIVANFHAGGSSSGSRFDSAFSSDFAANVMAYLGLSEFNPLLNTPQSPGYSDILRLQKSKGRLRYLLGRASLSVRRRLGQ
jgi:glycosyltransferase involved in cell wall biosynthesis